MSFSPPVEHAKPAAHQASRLLAFVQYSNVHIMLVALGLLAGTSTLFSLPLSIPVLLAGTSGAFLIYLLDRCWLSSKEDMANQPLRVAWIRSHNVYVWGASLLAFGLGAVGALQLIEWSLLVGVLLALGGVLYLLPLKRRLKRVWYAKPLVIAGAWAIGAVLFPIAQAGVEITVPVLIFLVYRLLFILPNVLLADWQDREGDKQAGLRSLAMFVEEHTLRAIAACCAVGSLLLGGWVGTLLEWPVYYYVDLVGPLLMLGICLRPLYRSYVLYGLVLDVVVAWPLITTLIVYSWG